jgi:hypothetical protein
MAAALPRRSLGDRREGSAQLVMGIVPNKIVANRAASPDDVGGN